MKSFPLYFLLAELLKGFTFISTQMYNLNLLSFHYFLFQKQHIFYEKGVKYRENLDLTFRVRKWLYFRRYVGCTDRYSRLPNCGFHLGTNAGYNPIQHGAVYQRE